MDFDFLKYYFNFFWKINYLEILNFLKVKIYKILKVINQGI